MVEGGGNGSEFSVMLIVHYKSGTQEEALGPY